VCSSDLAKSPGHFYLARAPLLDALDHGGGVSPRNPGLDRPLSRRHVEGIGTSGALL